MLKKVIGIKNVGKFADCKAAGDVEFRGLTLVFGENGRGKTTLCGVLRSLASGDASYISERQRLGTSEAPEIRFLTDSGTPSFKNGTWDTTFPELTVFDSCYVHENVYAGDFVAHEHKKNLHRVIVGKQGVDLNQKIADLDSESRQVAKDLRGVTAELKAVIPKGVTLDEFLPLTENTQADAQLAAIEAEIVALKRAKDIADAASLKELSVPSLPSGYEELLKQELPDVSADAETKVREHLAHTAANASHGWAEQGLTYIKAETCPFCGEDLTANQVIQAYREYFSEAYTTLKANASAMKGGVAKAFTDMVIERIGTTLESNHQAATFWREFVEIDDEPGLPEDCDWRKALLTLRDVAGKYAMQKAEAPLEPVVPGTDYDAAVALVDVVQQKADEYNAVVRTLNAAINERKQATSGGDLAAKTKEAALLAAAKVRHQNEVSAKCDEYVSLTKRKGEIEIEKGEAKAKLDEYSSTVFTTYCDRINELLDDFRASFRLADLRSQYPGGQPSSTFEILIRNERVAVGDPAEPRGKPRFGCTLSAGDRSTLALAFFLAQLEQDPSYKDMVVVFDDPFTSQDRFRRTRTQQLISNTHNQCKQVVVFSHDPLFLKLVYDNHQQSSVKTLQVAREGRDDATIAEWDIEEATQSGYAKDYFDLHAFVERNHGEPRSVVRKIRPVLEGFLRMRFPTEFGDGEWLGDFIKKIRDASSGTPLESMQTVLLEELESINDYSKKYHHDTSPTTADSAEISDDELVGFCRATFKCIGGY